jgi:hypothetical protein
MPHTALALLGGNLIDIGGTPIRSPIAVDENFIYARSAQDAPNDGLVILNKADGNLFLRIGTDGPSAIDATHPEYVFYGAVGTADDNLIYRLRKPLPANP